MSGAQSCCKTYLSGPRDSGSICMVIIQDGVEAQLIAFARTWFKLLAQGDWNAALAMLDEANSYGIRWTRDTITALVNETFGPDTHFALEFGSPTFSDPDLAHGSRDHHAHFGEFDGGGFWLDHNVPLNGHYSDLTAQFEFYPRADGYAAVLHDLHVM